MLKKAFLKNLLRNSWLVAFFLLLFWFLSYRISYFNFPIYDEVYYVEAAQAMYRGELDTNKVHPPLAKWLVSVPMYWLGDSWALAWRVAPLAFGFGGLILLYIFALRVGLNKWYAALAVLMLVGSKSWYILSRAAMLDIFLSFFVLAAAYFLYVFMVESGFPYHIKDYKKWWSYWMFCVVIGIAGATKWSGFFPLVFLVVPFWWFYIQETKLVRLKNILTSMVVTFTVFSLISIALLKFDVVEFLSRNGFSLLTHNSSMLPEYNPEGHQARGGFDAFWRYFVFDQGYVMRLDGYDEAKFSNNHLIAVSLAVLVFLYLLVFVGRIIRVLQKIEFEYPSWFVDKRMIFLLLYSLTSMVPWAMIPRNQYIYYFVPAFPTLILLFILFMKDRDWKLQGFYYILYFAIFIYGMNLVIPY